jgi:hypothetical protein
MIFFFMFSAWTFLAGTLMTRKLWSVESSTYDACYGDSSVVCLLLRLAGNCAKGEDVLREVWRQSQGGNPRCRR